MKLDLFISEKANLSASNRLLTIVVVVIGLGTLYNGFMIQKAMNSHRTILVPPGLAGRVEIGADSVSEDYIRAFVRHVSSLAFNYTPVTARAQFGDELLRLYDPSVFVAARDQFFELADRIEKTKTTMSFFIDMDRCRIDAAKKQIEVVGVRRQSTDDIKFIDSEKTYYLGYRVENGTFMLTDIAEKEDSKR